MKALSIAAAAMLFGTSALAWAPSTEPAAGPAVAKDPVLVDAGTVAIENALASHGAFWQVAADQYAAAEPVAWTGHEAALHSASAVSWDNVGHLAAGDPDLDLAVDPAKADDGLTGVGGPYEPVDIGEAPVAVAALDTTPRPAAQNYPPCRPGPGDDNCIQLYEPGVRVALASWDRPTGGLGDGAAATAMGGPYEPVGAGDAEIAMNGDGALDTALGEASADEVVAM